MGPPFLMFDENGSGPAGRTGLGTALVIAIAAVHRLAADGRERNFSRHSAAVARDAHHRALARTAIAFSRHLALVAAVLAALWFVCETTFCVERLFILAEHELLSAISTGQTFVIKRIHEALIS